MKSIFCEMNLRALNLRAKLKHPIPGIIAIEKSKQNKNKEKKRRNMTWNKFSAR